MDGFTIRRAPERFEREDPDLAVMLRIGGGDADDTDALVLATEWHDYRELTLGSDGRPHANAADPGWTQRAGDRKRLERFGLHYLGIGIEYFQETASEISQLHRFALFGRAIVCIVHRLIACRLRVYLSTFCYILGESPNIKYRLGMIRYQ